MVYNNSLKSRVHVRKGGGAERKVRGEAVVGFQQERYWQAEAFFYFACVIVNEGAALSVAK